MLYKGFPLDAHPAFVRCDTYPGPNAPLGGQGMSKVLCVVGARPNFMKIAPILRAFRNRAPDIEAKLVHTGQHYDYAMNQSFFDELGIPAPDVSLDVGSASHAQQTAEIMQRFEPVVLDEKPDVVLVVGDVNSTIACALVAAKLGVKVVHVEAGLRSRDRTMPEEINRILTDQLSDRLYTTEADALANLTAEGIGADKVVFAGNVMIDTLLAARERAVPAAATLNVWCQGDAAIPGKDRHSGAADDEAGGRTRNPCSASPLPLAKDPATFLESPAGYAVLTLHRPSNVDDAATLNHLLDTLVDVARDLPIVFPVHPRTRQRIDAAGHTDFTRNPRIALLPPIGYFEMLGLMRDAALMLTDSGGLQEETTALGIPCLTLRENTERPITITQGTNTLVGTDADAIRHNVDELLTGRSKRGHAPEKWDGHAAERIVDDLDAWLRGDSSIAPTRVAQCAHA